MDPEADKVKLESWKSKREKELGFKPQGELFPNFYLPYYNEKQLDDESNKLLREIKQNLGLAIATREIYAVSGVFLTQLMR
jgi:hypothetical protein